MEANQFAEFESKMRAAGLSDACITSFRHNYAALVAGQKPGRTSVAVVVALTTLTSWARSVRVWRPIV